MATSLIVAGLGIAAAGFIGRAIVLQMPNMAKTMTEAMKSIPKITTDTVGSKYYEGGFETKMSRREAALILGISPTANKIKIRDAFKKVLTHNHPDRGGSPYLAAKISEAKDFLENNK